MWNLRARSVAAAVSIGFTLGGCADVVRHPISPQQARTQVVDASRDIVKALHGEVAEAQFHYESCNDQGAQPFRGVVELSFWMPGVPRNEPADPQTVIKALIAEGWSTAADLISHSPTLRKNGINVILMVAPHPPVGIEPVEHVGVKVDGQCRDTFDHRSDRSILAVDIGKEIRQG